VKVVGTAAFLLASSEIKETVCPVYPAEERKKLQKLAARPDREIDLTDIPGIQEIPSDADLLPQFVADVDSVHDIEARFTLLLRTCLHE
jgi:hypothetical protein